MKAYKPFNSVTAIAIGLLLSMNTFAQKPPYQDPKLTSEERARDLISRLTLEEKALLMQDQSPAIPRLGIKKFNWWSEALHGLANNNNVTVFPEPIGMAASFDDSLVYKIFDATSDETRARYNEAKQKGIDVVVFVGGLSTLLEGEEMPVSFPGFKGGDRTDIQLPGVQRNCLKALNAAGKKVIFVNCSGSAIGLVPETETSDAILQAWYGGESGGQAVADVLFGDYNPSGKLPITFYKDTTQFGEFEDYSMKGRTYRYMSDPLFQFGYGLSYTTISIGNARISKTEISSGESTDLTIPIANTGKRSGTEIVQVYVHKINDVNGPLKTLRGFKRINVAAGKTNESIINLPYAAFEFYDETKLQMTVARGEYEIWYGNSSAKKDLKMIKIMIK